MKYSREWLPYLIFVAIILLVAVYALMPKPAPKESMSIGQPQVLQGDNTTAVLRIPISWESEIQPTYVAVDVQPHGAPETIALEDRDKYHLIRAPQRWVNVKFTLEKKATLNYDCLILLQGNKDFKIKAKLSNDDLKDTDALARAEILYSFEEQGAISGN